MIASPPSGTQKANTSDRPNPSGAVAAAVLRSARRSAGLSQEGLAASADVDADDVVSWENGSEPLASVPVTVVVRLQAALLAAGADPALVADLDAAMWCDLVIDAVDAGEDTGCLLADPMASERAFIELLDWAITGRAPARHRPPDQLFLIPADDLAASVISRVFQAVLQRAIPA